MVRQLQMNQALGEAGTNVDVRSQGGFLLIRITSEDMIEHSDQGSKINSRFMGIPLLNWDCIQNIRNFH